MGGARAKRAFGVLLLGATLAIVAAGCGGGGGGGSNNAASQSFSTYETSMQALGRTLGAAIIASGNSNINASGKAVAANLRHVQVELRAAAVKLAQITPPPQVKAPHALLVKGVREYADELDRLIALAASGNQREALGSIVTLKGIKDMRRASNSIAKAGFVIVTPQ